MKLRLLCLLPALLLATPGCIVVRDRHHHGRSSDSRYRRDCRPNQYWDGNECRHKGSGRGSRGHEH